VYRLSECVGDQAGVLAAAGLIALDQHPARLKEDHANARYLASAIEAIDGVQVRAADVSTNIVIFDVSATRKAPAEISREPKARGVLLNAINDRQMRAVTHYDVNRADCERAIQALAEVVTT